MSRLARLGALASLDVLVLATCRRPDAELARHLTAPQAWLAGRGVDGALAEVASAGLWLAAAWLAAGLLAMSAGHLPGTAGRIGRVLTRLVVPAVLRRLLAGTAGAGVLLAPIAAVAAPTHGPAGPPAPTSSTSSTLPAPSWPLTSHPAPTSPTPTAARPTVPVRLPAPTWPTPTPRTPTTAPKESVPATSVPTTPLAPVAATPTSRPADTPAASQDAVTVRPGDSLWLIAARRLGPQATSDRIASTWPRWYAANRDVIGDDPALIRPGTALHAPAPTAEESR